MTVISLAAGKEKKVAPVSAQLSNEIALQDSLMFAAYNAQDMGHFGSYFSPDLEWYQDNAGVLSRDTVMAIFAGVFRKKDKLTRTLLKHTLEVHPIKNFGAIETGMHRFTHSENGRQITGTFKFLMIWKHADGKWQVTRVVSYDH